MTLFRMMIVLAGGLVLLLAVVIVRAETTRLHYEVARCERSADELRQQLVEAELELARLRNPTRIKQRMEQAVGHFADEPPPPAPPKKKRAGR
jgi:cell division protein FtsL